ncbi:MAG: protein kinase [Proteobacteria bacterium]|nr:protein kinase [Pseudomonadota bacterium]
MNVHGARERAYRIFSAALEVAPGARADYVAAECSTDQALHRHVLRLLEIAAADAAATGDLLHGNLVSPPEREGTECGHFRLRECIGAGGMGAVYRAERTDGVPQAVALKVLSGSISAEGRARFLAEAKFLARLEHPAIARLIDVGVGDREGWIAMELVRGVRITDYCDAHALDLRARLRLLEQVIDAVASAHRQLVVHRDIKPSNVLVADDGQPKLIDFGIAAALSDADDDGNGAKAAGEPRRLFTPHYAAPEQVRGEPITVATDVFGLGALAYRLLCGADPYGQARGPLTYMLAVTAGAPELPSCAAQAGGRDRRTVAGLRGDLDAIVLKALAGDPSQRYATAQDLQADCRRFLTGRPVQARLGGAAYRLGKFVRRRAAALAVVALFSAGLLTAGVTYLRQQRQIAVANESAARRGEFLERLLKSSDPRYGRRDITVAELLDGAVTSIDESLGHEPLGEASMLGLIADTNSELGRYREGLAASDRQLELLQHHGGSALELARALTSRGELLRAQGHYAEATPVLRRALSLLGDRPDVAADRATALTELGMALTNTGGEREAEALYREAIALDRAGGAPQRILLGGTLDDLAVLLGNEGRYLESRDTAREAFSLLRQALPAGNPDLLSAEQTYAMSALNVHDPAAAEPMLRDIAQRSAAIRGAAHPDTLVAQEQLGETLTDLGRLGEAQQILRQSATTLEHTLGQENRYATGAWLGFAVAACQGDTAGAAPAAPEGLAAAQHVAAVRARSLPAQDWHRFAADGVAGLCLVQLHRYAEAEPLLVPAAAALESTRGRHFYQTQIALKALRALYARSGRPLQASQIATRIDD